MLDFRGIDCALAELAITPEALVIATAPTVEVFKKLRREDCVIFAPLIVNQFIADPTMKKPLEDDFGTSWWPGAESNYWRQTIS
jgi:hypothetical protein